MAATVLITGSSGLVGSACVRHFDALGWTVHGVDNNARRDFFGADGDTTANLEQLRRDCPRFVSHPRDIRDRERIPRLMATVKPSLVIHAAAQPSHDLAAARPFDDFSVNALGTLNLLEAVRHHADAAAFVFLSTNKVYGDAPNHLPVAEKETRWEYSWVKQPEDEDVDPEHGISEKMPIDQTTHSLFGVSKLAADVMVQEYGRYFGLKTCCFRAGCLTGGCHAGAEQHGFLAYLAKCVRDERHYRIFGYKGKQVRDNLHAADVALACEAFAKWPRSGEVYNLGGGRANSISVMEAIAAFEKAFGKKLQWEYVEQPRQGDHLCYISDCRKFQAHYPEWKVTRSLEDIISEFVS